MEPILVTPKLIQFFTGQVRVDSSFNNHEQLPLLIWLYLTIRFPLLFVTCRFSPVLLEDRPINTLTATCRSAHLFSSCALSVGELFIQWFNSCQSLQRGFLYLKCSLGLPTQGIYWVIRWSVHLHHYCRLNTWGMLSEDEEHSHCITSNLNFILASKDFLNTQGKETKVLLKVTLTRTFQIVNRKITSSLLRHRRLAS